MDQSILDIPQGTNIPFNVYFPMVWYNLRSRTIQKVLKVAINWAKDETSWLKKKVDVRCLGENFVADVKSCYYNSTDDYIL